MKPTETNNTEQNIIEVARRVFIEKGFSEANMSDIAARVGINRSGLHYYYRTKDRLFEAVFADIVASFVPTIHQIVLEDKPISERISEIADVYFDVMQKNPLLPIFAMKEIQRDAAHFLDTIRKLETGQYIVKIKEKLQEEMQCGKIRQIPIEFVVYTFYGLLFAPFLSKPLTDILFLTSDESFDNILRLWKKQVVAQMNLLLCEY